jgi:membrane associated rhomboid family serine protease
MQPFARHWPSGRPSVTAMLVVASIAAALAEWSLYLFDRAEPVWQNRLVDWLGLHGNAVSSGHWWQFATFILLHPQPFHLFANMMVLYFAGREVEPIVGLRHFAILYTLGNLIGGAAQWGAMALGVAPATMTLVGVSAGVAAVLAAYATILPELEVVILLFFVLPWRVRAKTLGLSIVLGAAALWLAQPGSEVGPVAILAGSAVGWAYAKQLGFGNPMAVERYLFDKRQHALRLDRMPAEQFIREELDPILEKMARDGARSLSRAERKLLEKGRAKLAARDRPERRPTRV